MGNCLVTKLKESVDNPNLPKFGEMTLYLNPSATGLSNFMMTFYGGGMWFYTPQTVTITSGNAHFTDASGNSLGTSMEVAGTAAFGTQIERKIYYENTNKVSFTVSDKYGIDFGSNVGAYPENFDELQFLSQIRLLRMRGTAMYGKFETLKNFHNLLDFDFTASANITGNVEDLTDWIDSPASWTFNGSQMKGRISAAPSHVKFFTGTGNWNFTWTAGERTGGTALCIWNCVFGSMDEINAYLIDTATATSHSTDTSSDNTKIVVLLRGQDPVLSPEAQTAKATIEGWGWTVTVARWG